MTFSLFKIRKGYSFTFIEDSPSSTKIIFTDNNKYIIYDDEKIFYGIQTGGVEFYFIKINEYNINKTVMNFQKFINTMLQIIFLIKNIECEEPCLLIKILENISLTL